MSRGKKSYWNYGDGINRTYYGYMTKTEFARTVTRDDIPSCGSVSKWVTDRMHSLLGQEKSRIDQNPGKVILVDNTTNRVVKVIDIVRR